MSEAPVRILFLGKADDAWSGRAAEFLTVHAPRTVVRLGRRGEPPPEIAPGEEIDYIVSYLSPWVVPAGLLARARTAAINFHPGPPEYPGIGCTNFAIYEGAAAYGVTCHHMAPRVDTGALIEVRRFPVHAGETVWSLTHRCYAFIAAMFYGTADRILQGRPLPVSTETWTRRPFRRAELDALCRLEPGMSEEEVARRIRATTYPGHPGARRPA